MGDLLSHLWVGPPYRAHRLRHVLDHWLPVLLVVVFLLASWGVIGRGFGAPDLFREDPDLPKGLGAHRNSPAIWSAFGISLLLSAILTTAFFHEFARVPGTELPTLKRHVACLAKEVPPFLLLVLLAAMFPVGGLHVGLAHTVLETLIGITLALVAVGGMTTLTYCLAHAVRGVDGRAHAGVVAVLARGFDADERTEVVVPVTSYLVVTATLLLLWTFLPIPLVPASSLSLLALWIEFAYALLVLVRPSVRLGLLLLAAGWLVLCNRTLYRARFPGVQYDQGMRTTEPRLVDPVAAFEAWKRREYPGTRPRVVVVLASGGAYRSAFFTAGVLDGLPAACRARLRLLTGASGGMVASAHRAVLRDPSASVRQRMLEGILEARTVGPFSTLYPVPGDSLSPVAQQLVRDVGALFVPRLQQTDRGETLDRQWPLLRGTDATPTSFASVLDDEAAGRLPSLVLTPMVVETGKPLFVTNLNVDDVKVEGYSVPNLFRLFPEAQTNLPIATAVRMNASFPYVSPAVELPWQDAAGRPAPMRVVDAGYYDNYGASAAVAILGSQRMRRWLRDNTSGLVFVHVRAAAPSALAPPGLARVVHFLTSPPEGVFAARESSMLLRNDVEIDLLRNAISATPPPPGETDRYHVDNFLFLLHEETAMSWYLTKRDRVNIDAAVKNRFDENYARLESACAPSN